MLARLCWSCRFKRVQGVQGVQGVQRGFKGGSGGSGGLFREVQSVGVCSVSRLADLVARLRQLSDIEGHQFWADTVSPRDPALFDCSRAGHRQLTDVYLLGLAQKKGGTLATFDRAIPVAAIVGARRGLLEVVAPIENV